MRRFVVVASVMALCSFAFSSPARAATEVLDQYQVHGTSLEAGLSVVGLAPAAQTFRAGLSGALSRVDVYLLGGPGQQLLVQIQSTNRIGAPSGVVLASEVLDGPVVGPSGDWVAVRFTSPAQVVAGTSYAIVISTVGADPTGSGYTWTWLQPSSLYPNGEMWACCWAAISHLYPGGGDHTFKTYVTVHHHSGGHHPPHHS